MTTKDDAAKQADDHGHGGKPTMGFKPAIDASTCAQISQWSGAPQRHAIELTSRRWRGGHDPAVARRAAIDYAPRRTSLAE